MTKLTERNKKDSLWQRHWVPQIKKAENCPAFDQNCMSHLAASGLPAAHAIPEKDGLVVCSLRIGNIPVVDRWHLIAVSTAAKQNWPETGANRHAN